MWWDPLPFTVTWPHSVSLSQAIAAPALSRGVGVLAVLSSMCHAAEDMRLHQRLAKVTPDESRH
jgi:hypothetical protein